MLTQLSNGYSPITAAPTDEEIERPWAKRKSAASARGTGEQPDRVCFAVDKLSAEFPSVGSDQEHGEREKMVE